MLGNVKITLLSISNIVIEMNTSSILFTNVTFIICSTKATTSAVFDQQYQQQALDYFLILASFLSTLLESS
jgi:hypothetical protein